jgi:hypothetical protein
LSKAASSPSASASNNGSIGAIALPAAFRASAPRAGGTSPSTRVTRRRGLPLWPARDNTNAPPSVPSLRDTADSGPVDAVS